MQPGGGGNEVCERRINQAARFYFLSGTIKLKPQAIYRPQTACGRYCPWEPTALRIRMSNFAQSFRLGDGYEKLY